MKANEQPIRVAYLFGQSEMKGGGEISLIDLMCEVRRYHVDPVGIASGPGNLQQELVSRGLVCHIISTPAIRPLSAIAVFRAYQHLQQELSKRNLHILHVNGARVMLYAGLAARRLHIPCIWHVRVLERDKRLDRIRATWADRIIANSNAVKQSLLTTLRDNYPVEVIYNGISMPDKGPKEKVRIEQDNQTPVILAVGRITPEKGYESLIDACSILQKKQIPFSCRIMGDAPAEGAEYARILQQRVHTEKLQEQVHFCGWQNNIPEHMQQATILVLPSIREAFGRVIIEAWAAGTPVIATRTAGPEEIISNGENGFLVPVNHPKELANMMAALLNDKQLQHKLRLAGYHSARKYSLNAHAAKIRLLYETILAQARHER